MAKYTHFFERPCYVWARKVLEKYLSHNHSKHCLSLFFWAFIEEINANDMLLSRKNFFTVLPPIIFVSFCTNELPF